VRLGIFRLLLEYALGANRRARALTLKEQDAGDAEVGIDLLSIELEHLLETFAGFIQLELLKAGTAVEKKQGNIVRRLLECVANGLE
jgi:hypothetical protein